jgi:hypothetical protein
MNDMSLVTDHKDLPQQRKPECKEKSNWVPEI